jgi:hypothetical protein
MLGVRNYLTLHIELVILLLLVLDGVVVLYSVVTDTAVLILSSLPAHRNEILLSGVASVHGSYSQACMSLVS